MPDTVMTMDQPTYRNRSSSIAALAAALAEAQKNFAVIPKDREVTVTTRTGGTYKFKYATLDAIMGATLPALSDQGLAISQALTEWGSNYAVETTLYHKSGEWISNVTPMFVSGRQGADGKSYPPGNQELGSAQTYARRYGYSALLCVTADEDDDGNHADGNHATGERIPFKPGARGTAGGGTQFRPERRSPGMAQTESLKVDPADRDMVQGDGRSQYEADKAKKTEAEKPTVKSAAIEKAKKWVDNAIGTISLPGQHAASLDKWWRDQDEVPAGAKLSPRSWLEQAAPDEYQRLKDKFNEIRAAAKEIAA